MIVLGNGSLQMLIRLRRGHNWIRVDDVLVREGRVGHRRIGGPSCDDGGRGWVMQPQAKECPKPPELERASKSSPKTLCREHGPADTLISHV